MPLQGRRRNQPSERRRTTRNGRRASDPSRGPFLQPDVVAASDVSGSPPLGQSVDVDTAGQSGKHDEAAGATRRPDVAQERVVKDGEK